MVGRGIRLGFGFLALAVANSAEAQGNLDQGKTAAQLYASACATCHKSPQSVSKTKWMFRLESFRESAAILAAYLKGQDKTLSAGSQLGRVDRHTSQAKSSETTRSWSDEDVPRPPADIPDVKR
jgi:hypothetical protein